MDQIILALLKGDSPLLTPTIGLISLIIAGIFYFRKIDIDQKTSSSSIELKRIESLMSQLTLIDKDLDDCRNRNNELYEQNIELQMQMRNLRLENSELILKIHDLENGK